MSYSKSYKLLQEVGEEKLRDLFQKHGMYKSAKILSEQLGHDISPYVVRHTWKRYNLMETNAENNI